MIPLSLYIHIPWCVQKCPYCDFNSHAMGDTLPEDAYIEALIRDLQAASPDISNRSVSTIFIGGGTPSLFAPRCFEKLFHAVKQCVNLNADAEITLEANPGTVEQERFIGFREAGINRLSIGVQSLQDEKLKALGRIHNASEAIKALESAKAAGFTNINLDLMHGLPNQSMDDALYDLKTAIDLKPTHLSWYQLTLEPNTYFHQHPPLLPHDDLRSDMQDAGQDLLSKEGFQQYEVSAYSRSGLQCQHNLNYWGFGDYLGVGAGAHSKLTDSNTKTISRSTRFKNPRDYLNPEKPFVSSQKQVTADELPLEFMMNALRLSEGVSQKIFEERTYLKPSSLRDRLAPAIEQGLLTTEQGQFRATTRGKDFLNELLSTLL